MKKAILHTILALILLSFTSVHSQIVISEIMRSPGDPVMPKSNGQWFEIYNNSEQAIDLRAWTIEGASSSHKIFDPDSNPREEPFYIHPGEFFVFVTSTDTSTNGGLIADYVNPIDLKGGVIKIYEPGNSTPVDAVTGFNSWGYDFFGGDQMYRISFVLTDLSADNNVQKNWTESTIREGRYTSDGEDKGSPGVLGSSAFLQMPKIEWDSLYGGDSYETLRSILITNDGGCIMGGITESEISGDKTEARRSEIDYWVIKTDENGTIEWDKTVGSDNDDELKSIAQTRDGGYILGGDARSGISGDKTEPKRSEREDFWLVKLDSGGSIQWDKTIGGDGIDFFKSIELTSDGGYILGGHSFSNKSGEKTENSKGDGDYWIVKFDSDLNIEWDKTIGGDDNDVLTSIIQTSDGGYIAGGESRSGISGDKTEATKGYTDFWVVKLDANGTILWDKTYGGDWNESIESILETKDGGLIFGGYILDNNWNEGSIWVLKTDKDGKVEWEKTYYNGNLNFLRSIQKTSDGGYILGGENSDSFGVFSSLWIIKTDGSGNILWEKTISKYRGDYLASIQVAEDGGYLIGAGTNIKYGLYDEPIDSEFWLIKLSPDPTITTSVSAQPFHEIKNLKTIIKSHYFREETLIIKLNNTPQHSQIKIFTIDGTLVLNKKIAPLQTEIEINTSSIQGGIYILSLFSNQHRESRKIGITGK